jgi:hypothetical protein
MYSVPVKYGAFVRGHVPPSILDSILLTFPGLYKYGPINYETNFGKSDIDLILSQLSMVLGLEGNVIECGSARCGTSILMAKYLSKLGSTKIVYACDSFKGFNPEELRKERERKLTTASSEYFSSLTYRYVVSKISRLDLSDRIVPVQGFFENTLPHLHSSFCFALIDCDLSDSILYSAESIWSRLSIGGRILFDDYLSSEFSGARVGIDEFRQRHSDGISRSEVLSGLYMIEKGE